MSDATVHMYTIMMFLISMLIPTIVILIILSVIARMLKKLTRIVASPIKK